MWTWGLYSGKLTTPLTFIVAKKVGLKLGSVKINFHKYILVTQHMLLVVQHMLLVAQHMHSENKANSVQLS